MDKNEIKNDVLEAAEQVADMSLDSAIDEIAWMVAEKKGWLSEVRPGTASYPKWMKVAVLEILEEVGW